MTVIFNGIPADNLVPLFWVEFDNSRAGIFMQKQRALLLGHSARALADTAYDAPSYQTSIEQSGQLYGRGAMLTRMLDVFRQNDRMGEVYALPLRDGTGMVRAEGKIVATGGVDQSGVVPLFIAGQPVPVAVRTGMTASDVATAIVDAIARLGDMPVESDASGGTVDLIAVHPGLTGNDIDVRIGYYGPSGGEAIPAGLTLAVTPMAGGAGAPDLDVLAQALGEEEYDFIAAPFTDSASMAALKSLMDDTAGRWAWDRQIYGHVFAARRGATAENLAFGSLHNNPHASVLGYDGSPSSPWEFAAAMAGSIGGAIKAHPARPTQTLPLNGVLAPPRGRRPKNTERQSLLSRGIAQASYAEDGSVSLLRTVTTYQKNKWGQPDQSYLDCETLFTLMAVTRRLRAATTQKFPRALLADDGQDFGPGVPVVTPTSYKAELVAQYAEMAGDLWVEGVDAFKAATVVERDRTNPTRLNVLYAPVLMNGLRMFGVVNQFRLRADA